jgi:hypothetical protein
MLLDSGVRRNDGTTKVGAGDTARKQTYDWIPAFAGMTELQKSALAIRRGNKPTTGFRLSPE